MEHYPRCAGRAILLEWPGAARATLLGAARLPAACIDHGPCCATRTFLLPALRFRLWEELEKPAAAAGSTAGAAGGAAGGTAAGGRSLGPGDRCFTCQQPQQQGCPAEAEEHYSGAERSGGSFSRQPWWRRSGGACGKVRPKPGFTCNADGSRLPLGPNVEFKVIDYG